MNPDHIFSLPGIALNAPVMASGLVPEVGGEIGQYLVAADTGLESHASARTREALLDELEEQLFYLHDTFELGDVSGMTSKAAALAVRLVARLQEEALSGE